MHIRLDYPLLAAYIAFFFPLAIYCLILAQINRRSNPVMVSGSWDCVGLLFAGSGILLICGPGFIARHFGLSWADWIFAWMAYYLLVIVGSVMLVWIRQSATVIYNVDPDLLNQVLERVLDRLGLPQSRLGHAVMIGPREASYLQAPTPVANLSENAEAIQPGGLTRRYPEPAAHGHQDRLDVEPFPAMSNVTLHWRSGSLALRQDVEDELRRNLDECRALDNPTAGWFFGISCLLSGFILVVIALISWVALRS